MKILVIGVGVIGSIYGWVLSQSNNEVVHLVRSNKRYKFSNGIPIDILDGRKGYRKNYVGVYAVKTITEESLDDKYDFVIIPTKPYQVLDVIRNLEITNKYQYFILSQNWGGTVEIDNIIDRHRYVYGDAKAGGTFIQDKLVASLFSGIDIGQVENIDTILLQKIKQSFKNAKIKTNIHSNILEYIWIQYAINAGLWPALVEQGSFAKLLKNKKAAHRELEAVRECLEVLQKMGIDLNKYEDTKMYLNKSNFLKPLVLIMMKMIFTYNKSVIRASAHALSDMKEIANSYGDLLKKGEELKLNMATMKTYWEYFKDYV